MCSGLDVEKSMSSLTKSRQRHPCPEIDIVSRTWNPAIPCHVINIYAYRVILYISPTPVFRVTTTYDCALLAVSLRTANTHNASA